ncbi:MAG: PLP-dependent aspartate aminotransferase family protein [Candidatus Methanoplasma sp.]|jgi:cystathionine beta-lyase|nr:PLP-dependent aspartate aminotransferase family protein [Candidatus Methanoplasma sp.]
MSDINTRLVHGVIDGDSRTGAVNVPIYQTSTYRQPELGRNTGYEYSRTGNPTREALEKQIADLEGGKAGFAFASGMAAIDAVLRLYGSGRTVVISSNVYGGTFRILDKIFSHFGLGYKIVDTSDLSAVEKSITPDVSAFLIESPANPLMTVTDISAVSDIARRHNIHTIVDNTFMTPYLQRPIESGADIVVHSATKYIGGHSDLVAGLAVVNDEELAERLHFIQNATGGILQPFDSFLALRGIKTLSVRMDRHVSNAEHVAEYLRKHPAVSKVYYPGLKTDPGYEINKKQASAGGGMISFDLKEGYDHRAFLSSTELIALAESLGGVESLLCHPSSMTHASIPADIRRKVGITDGLIRLSVGIEDRNDIIADLETAFGKSKRV